jgi:alpha-D-xyloside xylohydrolase
LWEAALEAHREGVPTMRAMILEYPDDPACDTLDRQYFLGGSLLVAPIFSEEGIVDYYLPAGRWTQLLTGKVQEGGRWYRESHGFLSLPLLVKPGTILALGAHEGRPDYEHAEGVTFRIYELADGSIASCNVPTLKGKGGVTCTVRRQGRRVEIKVAGAARHKWRVQLAGVSSLPAVASAKTANDEFGVLIIPAAGTNTLIVTLLDGV